MAACCRVNTLGDLAAACSSYVCVCESETECFMKYSRNEGSFEKPNVPSKAFYLAYFLLLVFV